MLYLECLILGRKAAVHPNVRNWVVNSQSAFLRAGGKAANPLSG